LIKIISVRWAIVNSVDYLDSGSLPTGRSSRSSC